jgi:hypothetical protein
LILPFYLLGSKDVKFVYDCLLTANGDFVRGDILNSDFLFIGNLLFGLRIINKSVLLDFRGDACMLAESVLAKQRLDLVILLYIRLHHWSFDILLIG